MTTENNEGAIPNDDKAMGDVQKLLNSLPDVVDDLKTGGAEGDDDDTPKKQEEVEVEFDENGSAYPVQFGKRVVDKMEKPVPFETFALNYVEQNGWGTKPVGKGGSDSNPDSPSKFKSKNEMFAYLEKNKIDIESTKGQDIIKNSGLE